MKRIILSVLIALVSVCSVAFSGGNFLTNCEKSQDFMLIKGNDPLFVTISGARMANYAADDPFTIENPNATLTVTASIDKEWKAYSK